MTKYKILKYFMDKSEEKIDWRLIIKSLNLSNTTNIHCQNKYKKFNKLFDSKYAF